MSKTEVRLTIQSMIDALFRMSGYMYNIFSAAVVYTTVYESIIDCLLIFIANVVNAYIYVTFNAYVVVYNRTFM